MEGSLQGLRGLTPASRSCACLLLRCSGLSVLYTRQQAELLVVQVEAEAARGEADEGEGR